MHTYKSITYDDNSSIRSNSSRSMEKIFVLNSLGEFNLIESSAAMSNKSSSNESHNNTKLMHRNKHSSRDISDNTVIFTPLILNITDVITLYGKNPDIPTFTLNRQGNLISLSWEPFCGKVSESGSEGLLVSNGIKWLPEYPAEYLISMYYKSKQEVATIKISLGVRYPVQIMFPRGICIRSGDNVSIPGSTISWLHTQGC